MKLKDLTEEDIWDIADYRAILSRGLNYYETGQIASMVVEGETLIAKVKGSYGTYDVEITIKEGNLWADCDCPYDGYGCKHIVAVLYKWLNEKKGIRVKKITRKEIDIDKELPKLSKDELRSILSYLCRNYEDAKADVILKICRTPDVSDAAKDIILKQIKDAFYTRNGFIDYEAVFDVVERLRKIKATILTASPYTRSALLRVLGKKCIDTLESCDDSSGSMGEFIIECLTDLGESIHEQNLSFKEKKKIIRENLDLLDKEQYGLGDGYIDLILQIPSTKKDYDFLINELKARMTNQKDGYERAMYRDMLTDVYKRAGKDNEYLVLLEENAKVEGEYLPLAQFWKEKGDLEKAISIAEKAIMGKTNRWHTYIDLFEFLEGIYRDNKNWEDLLRISTLYFKIFPSIRKYKEIKKIAEKLHKWDAIKPELIEVSHGGDLVEIYLFEKEYDKAYQQVMRSKGKISDRLRDKVASALTEKQPEKALKIYLPIVQEFIATAKRDGYGIAALYAKKVREIYLQQGQEREWDEYIARVREENKRRPALREEFRRL